VLLLLDISSDVALNIVTNMGVSFIHNINNTEFYPNPQTDAFVADWWRAPAAGINSQCISNFNKFCSDRHQRHTEKKKLPLVGIV